MKVKKICASNNHEAMIKVRAELGPDAVILHQRKVKPKGLLGYFKKPIIEVVAAIEDSIVKVPQTPKVAQPKVEPLTKPSKSPEELLKVMMENRVEKKPEIKTTDVGLTKEIAEIKNMLSTVVKKVNVKDLPNEVRATNNKELEKLYHLLQNQEIEEEIVSRIMTELMSNEGSVNKDELNEQLKRIINRDVIGKEENLKSKVIFFVGPTGVGKTTTIAKLAAHYSLNEGKKVGFISADTYRIAAVEQLKTYSDILNIPIEVIYEAEEIHQALERLNHKDIIMVDTAGRSHKNLQQVKELETLLGEIDEKEVFLVVSCTSKNNDIREIIETYQFLKNYKVILTKIDEATTYGTIINTALQTQKPISYMTTGQSVPDDIEVISVDKILSLIIKEA